MRTIVSSAVLLAGAVALGGMTAGMAAQGNRAQQNEDVLPALLIEVRGLRAAMEQVASAGPRVQLALGRLQLQEQRLNTMLRQLESVRQNLGVTQRESSQHEMQIAQMEEALKSADVRPDRDEFVRQVTYEIRELKGRLATASAEMQRVQAEEAALQQQISTEQGRWSDINRSLEELERALGRR